jgi:hypothetical protein
MEPNPRLYNFICCFSTENEAIRSWDNTYWPGIRIRCPSGATCLPAGCCFIELAKCGVIWHSEFRGIYLNVNVLRVTRKDG